ncbi:MAG TPA: hypothetical protein VJI66_02825 [Candidatus Paceibacterota bacterium]
MPVFIPRKAKAIAVVDAGNIVQSTISAIADVASAASEYSLILKEYVLDGLGMMLAKQIIRQLTASVVNWINSGFEGSPSFVQNPGAFFLDTADQITGDFLSKVGGPLVELCSPFSIDIRIALAFKYHPNVQKKYACTLGTIIKNSKVAVENASINGFTAGDFRQGGWPAFVSLTTEPQNNIYGAYLQAESELSWRVAQKKEEQRDELGAGKGFLSWRDPKCKKGIRDAKKAEAESNGAIYNAKNDTYEINPASGIAPGSGETVSLAGKSELDCPIETPGSTIVSALEANVNGPLHELQLADELNEIVNALFAQLATQILQKGLGGVSKKDSSGKSYLDKTISEINAENNPQLLKIKTELINNIATYKKNTITYKNNRDEALNIMLDAKNSYESVKACYTAKADEDPSKKDRIDAKIAEIDGIINTRIAPKTLNLLSLATEADERLKTFEDIENQVNSGKTLNDVSVPAQLYSDMVQNGGLTNAKDIVDSKEDLDQVRIDAADLKQDALRKSQECQLFN